MGNLLFSPSGRIGVIDFLKGLIILSIISGIMTVFALFNYRLGSMLQVVNLFLLYPLFVLCIKRSHDSGKSGWWSILWVLIVLIIMGLFQMVVTRIAGGEAYAAYVAAQEEMVAAGMGISEIMAASRALADQYGPELVRRTALPSAVMGIFGAIIGGMVINVFNAHEPNDNQYGPA